MVKKLAHKYVMGFFVMGGDGEILGKIFIFNGG